MKLDPVLFLLNFVLLTCSAHLYAQVSTIECNDKMCKGEYVGPEFVDGQDIAHQFSNKMSDEVGKQLKVFYLAKMYKKVDFSKIIMKTAGMGSGFVTYELVIPFMNVATKCEAFTSFDHCGGWNHIPEIQKRKQELQPALLPEQELDISMLKTTPEGLQEYWIQWQNKMVQEECRL